jgi:hypothetical protein
MVAIAFPLEQQLTRVETPFIPPGSKATLSAVLAMSGLPFIMAPTGTVSSAGVITMGTALPATYPNCYVYLPAGVAFAGAAAGWYFAQMTSTTVGTLYQTQYSAGPPQIPATPVVAVGPGAYTGVTTAQNGPSITIPAGAMQNQSALRVVALFSANANVNNKVVGYTLGGSTVLSVTVTGAGQFGLESSSLIWGRPQQVAGNPVNEVSINSATSAGAGVEAAGATYLSVNMGVNQALAFTLQDAVATDFSVLEGFVIELLNTSNIANS